MPNWAEQKIKRQGGLRSKRGGGGWRTMKRGGKTFRVAITKKTGPKGGKTVAYPIRKKH